MSEFDLLITSGVGPAEARRFVAQLAAHLEAVAEARGLEVHEVVAQGDARAPRSITLRLRGDASALQGELGTHALIHRSRGRAARKRWFAAVSQHAAEAEPPRGPLTAIPREDLVITACRAGGPGGQHVNKVSTAVRVHHLPSGLSIRSAAARSQQTNLEHALRRLASLLAARAEARQAERTRARRATHYQLERGRAIRSYHVAPDGTLRPGGTS